MHFSDGAMIIKNGLIEEEAPGKSGEKGLGHGIRRGDRLRRRCVIPSFVDPHTHMCFARRREEEFSLRLEGTPYLEILKRGGGILSSVRAVKEASDDDLFENTLSLALSALSMGTTTVEIKSGYGLDTETELRMLSVIRRVGLESPLDVVPTFMGAHAVAEEYRGRADDFVDLIVREMLPAAKRQGIARFCDIFCEEGVFSISQSEKILTEAAGSASALGARRRSTIRAGAARQGWASLGRASHGGGDEGLSAMAERAVTAILLRPPPPSLRKPQGPGAMIGLGVPVAWRLTATPGRPSPSQCPLYSVWASLPWDSRSARPLSPPQKTAPAQ